MKKMYNKVFTGKILLAFVVAIFSISNTNAQTPMYFKNGASATANTIPLNQASQKTQLLYTPTDFNTLPISGNITKIYFRNSTAGSTATYTNFRVSFIQNTSPSFPTTSFFTGLTTALSATTITVNANAISGGWFEIPIPVGSFPYDNSKTLVIEIQYSSLTGGISTTTSTSVGNKRNSGTSLTATTGLASTTWNDFGIDVIPAGPCVNPPVPGTVAASSSIVCLGEQFTLNKTGGTDGAGQTYQWQISPDNISWTNIPGATNQNLTTNQSVSNYYRLVVTCGVSVNSNSVQITTPASVAGTFTINSALPTAGTNFQTFNAAYNYIKCGINGPVVFNVLGTSGPYNEQLIMTPVPGASGTNTVTFNGNGAAISFLSTNTNQRAVIKLNGADYITFNNLIINAPGTLTTEYGFGVHLLNNADSNTINNCTININTSSTSTNFAGIVVSGSDVSATTSATTVESDFNTFSNNTITGGYYGLTLVGSTTVANGNNRIINNKIREFYFYGMYVLGSFNTTIEANEISRPTRAIVSSFFGIYFTSLSVSCNITRNKITNPFGGALTSTNAFYGIYFTANDGFAALENKVTNNIIYNLTGSGDMYGIYNSSSDNVFYYHNTLSMDGTPPTSSSIYFVRGFYQITLAGGIQFKNNIITISRSGTATKHAMYFATNTSTIESNKNDFYILSTAGSNNVGFLTTNQPTLANWQATSLQDAGSVANDPIFINVAAGNFTPTNASMNDLGLPLGILVDVNNATRSTVTPDMGAVEFAPGPCIAPPLAGNISVTPNPVCINALVSFSVTGNSTGLGQTYEWQASITQAGPYNPVSGLLTNPLFSLTATANRYYRLAVTCSGITAYSDTVLLTITPALPGNTYTINKALPTGGLNYNSFNAAKAAMRCGISGAVIFNVVSGSGPYTEQLILDSIPGTSANNTITFNGNGNTIQFNSISNTDRAVIKLNGTDHVTFDSLVIDATLAGSTYGYGVQLINNADSNEFYRCTIKSLETSTSTFYAGVVINATDAGTTTTGATLCDDNIFDSNTILGGYYGFTLVGSATDPLENTIIRNNTLRNFYLYGIYTSLTDNTLIEKNDISRPTRTTTSTFYGIFITGINSLSTINANRISNPFGATPANTAGFYGIYLNAVDADLGDENIIANNLIYNINGEGPLYGLYNGGSNNAWYYHNTISFDDATSASINLSRGFYQVTDANGIIFKNNIITIKRGGTGIKHAMYFATATSLIEANRNDYFVNGAGGGNFVGFYNSNQTTLANWQAASTQDANSVSIDPEYANIPQNDYTPTLGAIDGLGQPVGITTDILNAARSTTTPDIGAYEFTVPPCTNPPVAGTASVTPNNGICVGKNVLLKLTGNTLGSGQTYQWQTASLPSGPWTNIGPALNNPIFTWPIGVSTYFRAVVTCGGISSNSTVTQVTINPAFLSGFYTINPALPAALPNFQSFTTAVAALDCGITGFVTFDVAPGIYNEQIRMREIGGAGDNSRVTFRSASGNPASVTLTYDATLTTANYVLKLDSASYITYKNITITATNVTNGRAVELANTASSDSITNCMINAPVSSGTVNTSVGIFANALKGNRNVIKGNTVTNGSSGIYFAGTGTTVLAYDNVIDSNTINSSYYYGIYTSFTGRTSVSKNMVNITMPRNAINYGIYGNSNDSAYQYVANKINLSNVTAGTTYGLYLTGCDGTPAIPGRVAGNLITGLTGNTGVVYGIYQTISTYNNTVNNVVSIKTTNTTSYASFYTAGGGVNFHNNSLLNTSDVAGANNITAYFSQTSGAAPSVNIQNNIFSHQGGGKAMFVTNLNFIYSNYNTFYTTGPVLIGWNATNNYATLKQWIDTSYWDLNSIVYAPSFTSPATLQPDITNPNVWAMHGRGIQIPGNDYDFNNNPRPVTLTTGVPDMGAYEFLPLSLPTLLTATPATPAPGITQTFMYGTDTVAKVTYDAAAPVPTSVTLRRYSGVLPTGLSAGQQAMYFYTALDVPAQGAYKYKLQQYYIDPWRGFIPTEPAIKMGRTNASGTWITGPASTSDNSANIITDTALVYINRFTGLAGSTTFVPPVYTTVIDSSNRGTRFWVPYGHHYSFASNTQDMWLYLSAQDSANVTVRVNGTDWIRTYRIPANTARVSDIIPKSGLIDARVTDEGLFERGISITSDVPIVAYTHIYDGATSGASMLLPVGVYGYEYQSLNARQYYPIGGAGSYSWMSVMSDRDSTLVQITPSVITRAGRPAGVPFTVLLMRGQVYNIMGTINGSGGGSDLSGTRIRSIANASSNCYPIAVFSGSSRTAICNTTNGDNMIQQVFPSQAWGRRYLTFASANTTSNTLYNSNIFRVMVKDPTTVVRRNGTILDPLTLVVPGNYYEFNTTTGTGANGSIYVEADKPVMMAQYMVSTGANSCPGVTATGNGDPEMIYISPIEQGIKKAVFYNTNESAITANYVNIIIPTAGLTSLRIDGQSVFTDVFAHPFLTGYTGIRHNLGGSAGQHTVVSDSAFTAITYGLGSVESYGYNAGTLVKNLNALPNIVNTLGTSTTSDYTCVKAPFRFNILITARPQRLTWRLNTIPSLTPNANVTQNNPVPIDSSFINGRWFYKYTIVTDYSFSAPGTFFIPILVTDSLTIEGCDNTQEVVLKVEVKPAPVSYFTGNFPICIGQAITFNGTSLGGTIPVSSYSWNFGDNTTSALQNPVKLYDTARTYNVIFRITTTDGCIGDTIRQVIVNPRPVVAITPDSVIVCTGDSVSFAVQNPVAGVVYNWYTAATGGTIVFTGTRYTILNVPGTISFYVEGITGGCASAVRKKVSITLLSPLTNPVAVVDTAGVDIIRFRWNAVPGAIGYQVSVNGSTTWITPSSGATGLTHTVTGLLPLQSATLSVRALGQGSCQTSVSLPVTGRTVSTQIYIPNAFTPNGDGVNDVMQVYGFVIRSLKFVVFNQWGEKLNESTNRTNVWNGTFKGKMQPSGVYMYVCQIVLNDGSVVTRKGSVNLIR